MPEFIVKEAYFVRSYVDANALVLPDRLQVAFAGRSNVGKSSLINFIGSHKGLARVSETPGRTRLINLFSLNILRKDGELRQERQMFWIDLPGFGYAKISKTTQQELSEILDEFWAIESAPRFVLHLFDIRREPTDEDLALSRRFLESSTGYALVLTKSDQIPLSKRKAAAQKFAKHFGLSEAQVLLTSVKEKLGREMVWEALWNAK